MNKLENLKQKFYIRKPKIDLDSYGVFNRGLTQEEIDDYLRVRANTMNISTVRKKFNEIAGCNTMAFEKINGKEFVLMYRHDVERFADVLFGLTKSTYLD